MAVKAVRHPVTPAAGKQAYSALTIEALVHAGASRLELRICAPMSAARLRHLPGRLAIDCGDVTIEMPVEFVDLLCQERA